MANGNGTQAPNVGLAPPATGVPKELQPDQPIDPRKTMEDIVANPEFGKLNMSDQKYVLSQYDKDILTVPDKDIPYVIDQFRTSPEPAYVPMVGAGGFPTLVPLKTPPGQQQTVQQQFHRGQMVGAGGGAGGLLIGAGAAMAPEFVPLAEGYGGTSGNAAVDWLASRIGPWATNTFLRSGAQSIGGMGGNVAAQTLQGQNPFTPENLKQTGITGLVTGGLGLPEEALFGTPWTKVGRGLINTSVGAQAREIQTGNPAIAMVSKPIKNITTGDYPNFRAGYNKALAQGLTLDQATEAAAEGAGGRLGAAQKEVDRMQPLLDQMVNPVANPPAYRPRAVDVIDRPIDAAIQQIDTNTALPRATKNAYIKQLEQLRQSQYSGLAPGQTHLSGADILRLRRDVGGRLNFFAKQPTPIDQPITDAYRALYGNQTGTLHRMIPGSAKLDEELNNMISLRDTLKETAIREEAGRGPGPLRATVGSNLFGRMEAAGGKVLPAIGLARTKPAVGTAVRAVPAGIVGLSIQGRPTLFPQQEEEPNQ